jgi:hypothetical protein
VIAIKGAAAAVVAAAVATARASEMLSMIARESAPACLFKKLKVPRLLPRRPQKLAEKAKPSVGAEGDAAANPQVRARLHHRVESDVYTGK